MTKVTRALGPTPLPSGTIVKVGHRTGTLRVDGTIWERFLRDIPPTSRWRKSLTPSDHGEVRINFDGQAFGHLLDFYQEGRVPPLNQSEYVKLKRLAGKANLNLTALRLACEISFRRENLRSAPSNPEALDKAYDAYVKAAAARCFSAHSQERFVRKAKKIRGLSEALTPSRPRSPVAPLPADVHDLTLPSDFFSELFGDADSPLPLGDDSSTGSIFAPAPPPPGAAAVPPAATRAPAAPENFQWQPPAYPAPPPTPSVNIIPSTQRRPTPPLNTHPNRPCITTGTPELGALASVPIIEPVTYGLGALEAAPPRAPLAEGPSPPVEGSPLRSAEQANAELDRALSEYERDGQPIFLERALQTAASQYGWLDSAAYIKIARIGELLKRTGST